MGLLRAWYYCVTIVRYLASYLPARSGDKAAAPTLDAASPAAATAQTDPQLFMRALETAVLRAIGTTDPKDTALVIATVRATAAILAIERSLEPPNSVDWPPYKE